MARRPRDRPARRLFRLIIGVAALASPVVVAGCASSPRFDRPASAESFAHLRAILAAYDSAGFMTGPPDFPIVGRTVVLTGPVDSVLLGFAASMPPAALRFARDADLVAARYQVVMLVLSAGDTISRVDRREVVRLEDFEEAASREPRVVFQRFVTVPEGRHEVEVTVRELTSRKEAEGRFTVDARRGLSAPLLAYRAERRASLGEPPDLLLRARSTANATEAAPLLLIEDGTGGGGPVLVEVETAATPVWTDTVRVEPLDGGPVSAVTALPVHLLPPGGASLRVERLDDGTTTRVPLYIGLSPEWVLPTWEMSIEHLAYALDGDTLELWRTAAPGRRAELWTRFQERTDPDRSTPGNEFLARYFDRVSEANDRFDEPGRAGWETDRGQVLVKLGEPDRQRFVRPERQGEVPRIEWEYDESIPTSAMIVFEDASEFGVFVLTPRSRAILRRVERELAGEAVER